MKYTSIILHYFLFLLIVIFNNGWRTSDKEVFWNKLSLITTENIKKLSILEELDEQGIEFLSFSSNACRLAISGDKKVTVWDIVEKNKIAEWYFPTEINRISISPQGELLAVVKGNNIQLLDITKNQNVRVLESLGEVSEVKFSPDGKLLAAGFVGWAGGEEGGIGLWGGVILWETETYTKVGMLRCESGVYSIDFSPNARILAVSTYESRKPNSQVISPGRIELWEIMKKKRIGKLIKGGKEGLNLLAFSPTGDLIASEQNNLVRLWKVETQQHIRTIRKGKFSPSLSFSYDGQLLAIGGNGIWLVANGKQLMNLPKESIAYFSPNGKIMAIGVKQRIEFWGIMKNEIRKKSR